MLVTVAEESRGGPPFARYTTRGAAVDVLHPKNVGWVVKDDEANASVVFGTGGKSYVPLKSAARCPVAIKELPSAQLLAFPDCQRM